MKKKSMLLKNTLLSFILKNFFLDGEKNQKVRDPSSDYYKALEFGFEQISKIELSFLS